MSEPFFTVHDTAPNDPTAVQVGQRWFVLKAKSIPFELPEDIRQAARLLFKEPQAIPESDVMICLCADSTCPRKSASTRELPDCPRNCFGICVDATFEANDRTPLSLPVIAYVTGLTKQMVDRHYLYAKKALIQQILNTPELKEYCISLGIGNAIKDSEAVEDQ